MWRTGGIFVINSNNSQEFDKLIEEFEEKGRERTGIAVALDQPEAELFVKVLAWLVAQGSYTPFHVDVEEKPAVAMKPCEAVVAVDSHLQCFKFHVRCEGLIVVVSTCLRVQLLELSKQGNVQAMVEVASQALWGNRSVLPASCFIQNHLNGTHAAVHWLLQARGPVPSADDSVGLSSPVTETKYLAHEYLVVAHLARFVIDKPLFATDEDALNSLQVLSHVSLGVTEPRHRVLSRAVLAYHRLVGQPQHCITAQTLYTHLAQAVVLSGEGLGYSLHDDVLLWNTWEDQIGLAELQEHEHVADYLRWDLFCVLVCCCAFT
jgi:hypothetical protein